MMNKRIKKVLIVGIFIVAALLVIYLTMNNLVPIIKDHVMRMHGIQ